MVQLGTVKVDKEKFMTKDDIQVLNNKFSGTIDKIKKYIQNNDKDNNGILLAQFWSPNTNNDKELVEAKDSLKRNYGDNWVLTFKNMGFYVYGENTKNPRVYLKPPPTMQIKSPQPPLSKITEKLHNNDTEDYKRPTKESIKSLLEYLSQNIYGKNEAIRLCLLSAIAQESAFLLGLPGLGKSMISRRIAKAFNKTCYFEYLMNEFSTPEEIFGPISMKALDVDEYKRKTLGYLPQAYIAFLDEIWKSNSAILNTLLAIINEKIFHNGSQVEHAPLIFVVAASNETPQKGKGLEALYDRFIIRYKVEPANEEDFYKIILSNNKEKPLELPNNDKSILIDIEAIKQWQSMIDKIKVGDDVKHIIHSIRQELITQKGAYISDRRWKKIVHILRTSAFLNGRDFVDIMDCSLIEHCIWDTQEQLEKVRGGNEQGIIEKVLSQNSLDTTCDIKNIECDMENFKQHIDKTYGINGDKLRNNQEAIEATAKEFDKKYYNDIAKQLDGNIEKIKKQISPYQEEFSSNLFADKKYVTVLLKAINEKIKELEIKKNELEKERSRYAQN